MAKTRSQKVFSTNSDPSKTGNSQRRRRGGGPRHQARQSARFEARRAEAEKRIQKNTETALIIEHPGTFDSFPYNGEKLRRSLKSMYPDGATANLKVAPSDGIFLIKPDAEVANTLPEGHPGFYLLRVDNAVSEKRQEILRNLFSKVQTHAVPRCTENGNRSATGAYHLGVWNGQRAGIQAVSNLQKAVARLVSPRINMFNRRYARKGMIERLEKAHKYINATLGKLEHYVNLGGSFFTIAVKEGSSERLHLDFRDDHRTLSWLVPMGSYTGGDFIVPQLGYRVPVRPGQALACTTRVLAHCGTAVTEGTRIAFTLFSNANILAQSTQHPIQ
ncbi:hypothetical protein BKA70DRAFT_1450522 [Coprinopsis sp. MPI-PUGE-AT-0042]|nr:hypothetical protein BKA70DRAFT_1450522 [Coprinopsis sp. MPI-PUGE-AT-0042]